MSLLSLRELSIWTRQEIDPADSFARSVIAAASDAVRLAAGQPSWTEQTAPTRARQIAAHLAARSYLNPDSLTREGIGPISEARSEDLAQALHLTTAERAELATMSPFAQDGLPGQQQGGVLWIQPLAKSTPVVDDEVVISGVVYGSTDDLYAFTPPTV